MKYLLAAGLALGLVACATTQTPARLPEPTRDGVRVVQWEEYCAREGAEDPACIRND